MGLKQAALTGRLFCWPARPIAPSLPIASDSMTRRPPGGALCYGVRSIAEHLGVKPRQALRLVELNRIPHFREGRVICAVKPSLDEWVARRAADAEKATRL